MFWGSEAKKYNYLFESVENQTRSSILTLSVCINVKISTKRALHSPAPAHQVQISVLRQLLLVSPPASRFIKVSNFNASLRNPEKVNVVQPSCFLPSCSENPSWSLLWILLSCIHRDRTRLKSDRWINPSLFGLNGDCFGMCTLNTFSSQLIMAQFEGWIMSGSRWIMDHGSVSSTFRPS